MSSKNRRKRKKSKLNERIIEHGGNTYKVVMFPDGNGTCTVRNLLDIDTYTVGHLYENPKNTGLFDEQFLLKLRSKES